MKILSLRNYRNFKLINLKQRSRKSVATVNKIGADKRKKTNIHKYRARDDITTINMETRRPRKEIINRMEWTIKGNPRNMFSKAIHSVNYNSSLLSIRQVALILRNAEIRDYQKAIGQYEPEYRTKKGHRRRVKYSNKEEISKSI